MSSLNRFEELPLKFKALIVLSILFFLYSLNYHFFDGVLPIHEWRKTDSLSLAWNYYKGSTFLLPETNHISSWANRNATAEFPLIYFLVGKLWQIFGHHEWIGKVISFSTLLSSLVLFSDVINNFLKSQLKTLIFIGVIFSSPVLLFYSDTLLPNVFSFSFVMISAYFLFQFIVRSKNWALAIFTIFLTLSILIKITVLISVFTFAGTATIYFLFYEKNLFSKHLRIFLILLGSCLISLFLTYLWYSYAINYNTLYHSTLFSTTIRPIWEVDAQRQKEIWDLIWKHQFNLLFNYWALLPTIVFVCYLIIRNKMSIYFYWLLGIGFIGAVTYIILWFWVFDVHDYYLIEILYLPLIIFFIALKHIEFKSISNYNLVNFFPVFILILIFLQAVSYTQISFGKNNVITKNTFLVSKYVKGNWGYFHWYHNEHLKKLQMQISDVQQIIREQDTVFCLSDPSPNTHLYTIGRKGFSYFCFSKDKPKSKQLPEFVRKGVRYLLVVGNEPLDPMLKQFTKDTMYAKNSVFIFDLRTGK